MIPNITVAGDEVGFCPCNDGLYNTQRSIIALTRTKHSQAPTTPCTQLDRYLGRHYTSGPLRTWSSTSAAFLASVIRCEPGYGAEVILVA